MRPRTIDQIKWLCRGCRDDRYNMGAGFCERPGVDAPVTCDHCWHLDPDKAVYNPHTKHWLMPCHTDRKSRWEVEWVNTGRKPNWNPYY